jgi:hypothetical protein
LNLFKYSFVLFYLGEYTEMERHLLEVF